MEQET
jgi:hypothetical protein